MPKEDYDEYKSMFKVVWDSPYSESENDPHHYLNLDKFLSKIMLTAFQIDFTVRDIIKVTANVLGGVHLSEVMDDREKSLIEAFKLVLIDEKPNVYLSIASIAKVVVQAAQPIKEAIEGGEGIEP
jgi:hypothetical protein